MTKSGKLAYSRRQKGPPFAEQPRATTAPHGGDDLARRALAMRLTIHGTAAVLVYEPVGEEFLHTVLYLTVYRIIQS